MDSTQLLLLIVIIILTIFLIVIGIQVFFILKELRVTLNKLNKVLTDAGQLTEKIKEPTTMIAGLAHGIKTSLNIFESLRKKPKKE